MHNTIFLSSTCKSNKNLAHSLVPGIANMHMTGLSQNPLMSGEETLRPQDSGKTLAPSYGGNDWLFPPLYCVI